VFALSGASASRAKSKRADEAIFSKHGIASLGLDMPQRTRGYSTSARNDRIFDYNAEGIIPFMDWKTQVEVEFQKAEAARARGNEGQARVCARRAAGIAIREYLTLQGIQPPSVSAYDLLNLLKEDPRLSSDLKLIADHLTLRVTEEFKLPVDADLIAEARKFCEDLLK